MPSPTDPSPPTAAPLPSEPRRFPLGRLVRWTLALGLLAGAGIAGPRALEGARATLDAADARADSVRAAFEAVDPLSGSDLARLRRSLNPRHVALGRQLGVEPLDSLRAPDPDLVRVETTAGYLAGDARYSVARLTPDGVASLDSVAARFRAGLAEAGLPPVRLTATSILRTAATQDALRQVNANAAAGTSSHEFGTTYDLSYRRFALAPDASGWGRPAVDPRVPRPLHPVVTAAASMRLEAALAEAVAANADALDALLGRALAALEDDGVLVVIRELRQTVYHVTVARRLVEEADG